MKDTQDNPSAPGNAPQSDELIAAIRTALAPAASADARSAGAIACQAILSALDPMARPLSGVAPTPPPPSGTTPTSPSSTSPLATLVAAVGQMPREQVLGMLGNGLRWLLAPQAPTYLARPAPPPTRPPGSGS
jgi:hypothetical protein